MVNEMSGFQSHGLEPHSSLPIPGFNVDSPTGMPYSTSNALDDLYQQLKELDKMDHTIMVNTEQAQEWLTKLHRPEKFEGAFEDPKIAHNFLTEQLDMLSSLQRMVDGHRSSLRRTIGIHSRPSVRPLHILDLPDELLTKIFVYVKEIEIDVSGSGVGYKQIQNVRLTCRRFCNAGSHLLLNTIHVGLNPSSLERLEEVSQHPTISKGVRVIQLDVQYYEELLASDIREFARHNIRQLTDAIQSTGDLSDMAIFAGSEYGPLGNRPHHEVAAALHKGRMIQRSWDSFYDGVEPVSEEDSAYQRMLFVAQEEYQRRCSIQQRLCEDGNFIRVIAACFARIPTAKRLEIRDDTFLDTRQTWNLIDIAEDENVLMESLTQPSAWRESQRHGPSKSILEIPSKLPCAIHTTGTHLTHLKIELHLPVEFSSLVPNDPELHVLEAAMQHLRTFEFSIRNNAAIIFRPSRTSGVVQELCKLLTAFMNTDSLEGISVDCHGLWHRDVPPPSSLGSPFTSRRWQNLETVSLNRITVHLAELESFFKQLDNPIPHLSLIRVSLLSGLWAEVLDIWREKSSQNPRLEDPHGAECGILSDEDKENIFGDYTYWDWSHRLGFTSPAEAYIRGKYAQNPLRRTVDGGFVGANSPMYDDQQDEQQEEQDDEEYTEE